MGEIERITPEEAAERMEAGAVLIDVRTPAEFRSVHPRGAKNIPLQDLSPSRIQEILEAHGVDRSKPVLLICRTGLRSASAADWLATAGYRVACVEGGVPEWEAAGLPVARDATRRAIPLERQVFLAAGSLVLAGVLLGAFVHPAWLALAGFVGAGLVFAGATGICGMAMLLARMPWNRA